MLVDLRLEDKLVIVVGGGNQAEKRIKALISQGCEILVLSDKVKSQIEDFAKKGKIKLKKQKIRNTKFLQKYKPFLVITTTQYSDLNRKIVESAKKLNFLAYTSDNPEISDFGNLSVIDVNKTIQVGISTGGASPIMAKKLKSRAELAIKNIVNKNDIYQIQLQNIARKAIKTKIQSQTGRKKFLYSIINDSKIKQLIKDQKFKSAEKRAMSILEGMN